MLAQGNEGVVAFSGHYIQQVFVQRVEQDIVCFLHSGRHARIDQLLDVEFGAVNRAVL
ncbi:hypothetical protein D3C87_1345000 [compost metagenome]